ncbi:MAG: acyltransferase [Deltaproteobacteria bacterium]|nr:acyltransferase [Deltaproteobacteria bacterium]
MKIPHSHGTGRFSLDQLGHLGLDVVLEEGVRIFHPETIELGDRVYVGHDSILKGYHLNRMRVGEGSWIGQQCFLHSAGGLTIGREVGLGPGVKIITSHHEDGGPGPILRRPLVFLPVELGDGCDVGIGACILPGTTIGRETQVAAGAVVKGDFPDHVVIGGVPARIIRRR